MALDTTSGLPAGEEVTVSQTGPAAAASAPALAEVDLLIERADLGPGCYTAIAQGSRIPPHLVRLPNTPYRPSVTLGEPARGRRRP